jgi:hypothetical protein
MNSFSMTNDTFPFSKAIERPGASENVEPSTNVTFDGMIIDLTGENANARDSIRCS